MALVAGMDRALAEAVPTAVEARELHRAGKLNELIERNMRLALFMAKRYAKFYEPEELEGAAFEILVKAAHSYDPDSPVAFSTWAAMQLRLRLHNLVKRDGRVQHIHVELQDAWLEGEPEADRHMEVGAYIGYAQKAGRLTARQAQVLWCILVVGTNLPDAAGLVGIHVKTVELDIREAVKSLEGQ